MFGVVQENQKEKKQPAEEYIFLYKMLFKENKKLAKHTMWAKIWSNH